LSTPVNDGDTIELGEVRLRTFGIDAPDAKSETALSGQWRDLGDAMARRGMASAYLRYLPQYMDAKVEAGEAWHVQGGFY
jgi:endonuclease YncB( thermonuclease family)